MNPVKVLTTAAILICFSFSVAQTISKEQIENSEKLIGLEFTDAERDSMMDNLNEQLESYKHIRDYLLKNSIPPALDFNPIPVKYHFPD